MWYHLQMQRKIILSIGHKFAMFQFHPSFIQLVQVSWEVLAPHSHCRPGIWDLFFSSSLLDCSGVPPHYTLLTQHSVNEIHLPGIPGSESEPGLFVPSICSACLSFVLTHSSGNAGVAAARQWWASFGTEGNTRWGLLDIQSSIINPSTA